MSNKDLFKEAIADAKAVREAALANAKVALEEALAPKLQSMLSAKLQEMEKDEEAKDLEEVDHSSDSHNTSDPWHKRAHAAGQADAIGEGEDAELEEDFDLSEILAELEADELDEAKKKKKEEDDELNEAEEGEEEEGEEEEEEAEEEGDEEEPEMEAEPAEDSGEKLTDLTVDELKDIIKDIISAEMGGADMGGGDEMAMDMGDMGGEEGGAEDEIAVDEMYGDDMDDEMANEIDLEELLAELDALDESDDEDLYEIKRKDAKKKEDKKKEDEKKEMKEAIATINTLRSELNEVNLLNAKLLYVNKIFKARNLNESQKLKVIAQFDKATTAKEAKTIFESMSAAIATTSKKSALKESIGFASKAAGVAPKKNIVEVDETMSRWQMLAGIKKF
jgi:hypothetical protein